MRNKLLFQTPNLKTNLFVLMLSLFISSFAQTDSRWCGSIENFEFTNGQESIAIEDYGTYDLSEIPDGFYLNSIIHGYSQSLRYKITNLDTDENYQIVENLLPYTFPAGNNEWNLGTGTFRVKATLHAFDHGLGWSCDTDYIIFTITDNEPCLADAGTLTATETQVCSTGEVMISAHANGDAVVPADYSVLYVLTQGEGLVIQQVSTEA
ncbi:hypothetical protein, partial [Winogradskyella sp. A2]|uniref:hypothetical protein n=1 Tax=Winogradskyella sp. A2 TaxID=3366944 RepID=UPI00398C498C